MAAVLRKETLSELRGKHGLFTSLLFAVMTVSALGMAAAKSPPTPTLAAGMLWVALLFAGVVGVARTFIVEEEQGTGDLLRLWARPEPVFWGKTFYNLGLILVVALVVLPLFVLFVGVSIASVGLLLAGLLSGCAALATAIGFCGSLVARSNSRSALAGVISVPVLLPVVLLGVGALRVAFGDPSSLGWTSVLGLAGLATAFAAAGPYLYAAVWKQ
ncbi:MAG: heme exporter protein CcmB [Armatimonadota bacterium]|nr:heme exporter protein CcmB [Armatimonadota bacterium]